MKPTFECFDLIDRRSGRRTLLGTLRTMQAAQPGENTYKHLQ
jgi:hypothetical protein